MMMDSEAQASSQMFERDGTPKPGTSYLSRMGIASSTVPAVDNMHRPAQPYSTGRYDSFYTLQKPAADMRHAYTTSLRETYVGGSINSTLARSSHAYYANATSSGRVSTSLYSDLRAEEETPAPMEGPASDSHSTGRVRGGLRLTMALLHHPCKSC